VISDSRIFRGKAGCGLLRYERGETDDGFPRLSSRSKVSGDARGATLATIEGANTSEVSEGPTEVEGDGTRYGSVVSRPSSAIDGPFVSKAFARTVRLAVRATPTTALSRLLRWLSEVVIPVLAIELLLAGSAAARRRSETRLLYDGASTDCALCRDSVGTSSR
jgi:hypothetical protein